MDVGELHHTTPPAVASAELGPITALRHFSPFYTPVSQGQSVRGIPRRSFRPPFRLGSACVGEAAAQRARLTKHIVCDILLHSVKINFYRTASRSRNILWTWTRKSAPPSPTR